MQPIHVMTCTLLYLALAEYYLAVAEYYLAVAEYYLAVAEYYLLFRRKLNSIWPS